MPDYIDIVVQETPVYVDVIKSGGVYLDFVFGSVDSVNGQTGDVVLTASDVGADASGAAAQALIDANDYTDTEVSALSASVTAALTTKRDINARVSTITTATSITPNLDSFDQYVITALASNITINASTGGANGSGCLIWIKDNGTARTITLNANYVDLFGQVPATTTINKWTVIGFVRRNEDSNKDHVIAGNTQA